jgi:hypothetical protein
MKSPPSPWRAPAQSPRSRPGLETRHHAATDPDVTARAEIMMKRVSPLAAAAVVALALCGALPAVVQAQTLHLQLNPSTITFPPADPDTTPVISAAAISVTYGVRDRNTNDYWTLTMLANGDLVSGAATISVSNMTWTANPSPPFRSGTMSRTVAQLLASGNADVRPDATGTVVFRLNNSWTYNVGVYTQTIVFTITSQ